MLIFDSKRTVINGNFAEGIAPPRVFARSVTDAPTALDVAWKAGFDAAMESEFSDVLPPAHFTLAERDAFSAGSIEGYRQLDWELEQARAATASSPFDLDDWYMTLERRDALCGHA